MTWHGSLDNFLTHLKESGEQNLEHLQKEFNRELSVVEIEAKERVGALEDESKAKLLQYEGEELERSRWLAEIKGRNDLLDCRNRLIEAACRKTSEQLNSLVQNDRDRFARIYQRLLDRAQKELFPGECRLVVDNRYQEVVPLLNLNSQVDVLMADDGGIRIVSKDSGLELDISPVVLVESIAKSCQQGIAEVLFDD